MTRHVGSRAGRPTLLLAAGLTLASALGTGTSLAVPPEEEVEFTDAFAIERCRALVPTGRNAYLSLRPGHFLRLQGMKEGALIQVDLTVLGFTRHIDLELNGRRLRAHTRLVEERTALDGRLVRVSRHHLARCQDTSDVFSFGEEVDIYEGGEVVGHEGSWRAGEEGALPGLVMPSRFLLGARYLREVAPEVALDRAQHVAQGLTVVTPAGTFQDVVKVVETTPLDPDEERVKLYAPDVGLIYDDGLELVAWRP